MFNMESRKESMIVSLVEEPLEKEPDVSELGHLLCGRTVYVNWPHMIEARVVAVSSNEIKIGYEIESHHEGGGFVYNVKKPLKTYVFNPEEADQWRETAKEIQLHYATRWGMDIGQTATATSFGFPGPCANGRPPGCRVA